MVVLCESIKEVCNHETMIEAMVHGDAYLLQTVIVQVIACLPGEACVPLAFSGSGMIMGRTLYPQNPVGEESV